MRSAYVGVARAIVLSVVLQAVWIALAWFLVLSDVDDGKVFEKSTDPNIGHSLHTIFGMMVLPLLGLVLLGVSFAVKVPGAVRWAGLVLLLIAVQIALAFLSFAVPVIGALHGLNAFAVAGLAAAAAKRVGTAPAETARSEPAAV